MRLPEDKKLVRVMFTYEDGSTYTLDETNSVNFQNNIKSTSVLSVRGNHYFAPVEWDDKGHIGEIILDAIEAYVNAGCPNNENFTASEWVGDYVKNNL